MPKVKVESIIDKGVYTLILLSTLAIILESDQELSKAYHRLFQNFEIISVLVFSVEYIYRTTLNFGKNKNLKYNYSFYGLIDLIAVLPFSCLWLSHFDAFTYFKAYKSVTHT